MSPSFARPLVVGIFSLHQKRIIFSLSSLDMMCVLSSKVAHQEMRVW